MANINDVLQDGEIFIEPRLQEFLNKKKYFEEHNIEPSFSLEKEYNITREDKKLIKEYLNGNKKIYKFNQKDQFLDLVDTTGQKFPSNDFKQDERFQRFKTKMMRNKEALKQRHNYSEWNDGYTKILPEESNNNNRILSYEQNNTNFNSQTMNNNYNDTPFNIDSRRRNIENQYSVSYGSNNQNQRNIKYTNPQIPENYNFQPTQNIGYGTNHNINQNVNTNVKRVIGNLNSYSVNSNNNKYQFTSEMDPETKLIKPSLNSNGKTYYNTSRYQTVPYMGSKEGLKDINMENNLRSGEEDNNSNYISGKSKSTGYPNPREHYFDYISNEYQNPNNFVLPFPRGGENTRQNNHTTAKKIYKRDIM